MAGLVRTLKTTEYFTLAFGTMVGVGWLILIDDWLSRGGPGGAMLGFLIGGILLIPVAWVYGRFVQEIPDASSEVAYATSVFPTSLGSLAGWLMTLAYLIVCPWEAVAIGRVLGYLIPAIQTIPLYRIGGNPVFAPALVLGVGLTLFIVWVNFRGVKLSARLQNYTTFGLLFLFALFSLFGWFGGSQENRQPLFAHSVGFWGPLVSIILVLQIVPYFLTGFESVPKCVEEADVSLDPQSFRKAIYLGLAVGTLFYVVIIAVVSGLAPWKSLITESYATAVAFDRAFHSQWMIRIIFIAALFSLVKVFNGNFIAASRLVFGLGRRGLIPPSLGKIHPAFQTPSNAILLCGAVTILGAFLGRVILVPITEVGSLCSAFGWMITCLAFARSRSKAGAPSSGVAIAIAGSLVALMMLCLKLIPQIPGSFGRWEYLALGIWLALGVLLSLGAQTSSSAKSSNPVSS